MASVDEVAQAIADATLSLLNGSGVTNPPFQCGVGWPFGNALSEIVGQGQAQVTVFPQAEASRTVTNRKPVWRVISEPEPTLFANVTATDTTATILLYGYPTVGNNLHTLLTFTPSGSFIVNPGQAVEYDAFYQVQGGDTLEDVVAGVAAAIEALGLAITVNAAGETITIAPLVDSPTIRSCQVNIGGNSTMAQEVARVMMPVQVSVWAADGPTRNSMSKQIEGGLCIGIQPQDNFLYASDGSAIRVRKRGSPRWVDQSQSSYSLYEAHVIYECEYPVLQIARGTQVEALPLTVDEF